MKIVETLKIVINFYRILNVSWAYFQFYNDKIVKSLFYFDWSIVSRFLHLTAAANAEKIFFAPTQNVNVNVTEFKKRLIAVSNKLFITMYGQ